MYWIVKVLNWVFNTIRYAIPVAAGLVVFGLTYHTIWPAFARMRPGFFMVMVISTALGMMASGYLARALWRR